MLARTSLGFFIEERQILQAVALKFQPNARQRTADAKPLAGIDERLTPAMQFATGQAPDSRLAIERTHRPRQSTIEADSA